MRIVKIAKSTLKRVMNKKLRRRTREAGVQTRRRPQLTEAELLIQSWYGKSVENSAEYSPANYRAAKRIEVHTLQWKDTPKATAISRQVRRRQAMGRW